MWIGLICFEIYNLHECYVFVRKYLSFKISQIQRTYPERYEIADCLENINFCILFYQDIKHLKKNFFRNSAF